MAQQLNDVTLIINDVQVSYTGESLKITDGLGESSIRNQTAGAGQTDPVYSENLDSKTASVMFSFANTAANDKLKRAWKLAKNGNVIEVVGPPGSGYSKTITEAALVNDPEANFAQDGDIDLEFKGKQAV